MAEVPVPSCRIFIRYGSASAGSVPTEDDIRQIFSVYGHIVGMFYVKDYVTVIIFSSQHVIENLLYRKQLYCISSVLGFEPILLLY